MVETEEVKNGENDKPKNQKNPEQIVDDRPMDKKIDIYRNALKRTIKTRTENIDEDPVLRELRNTLKIDSILHQKLKEEVAAELEKTEQILKESKLKISKIEKMIVELAKQGMDVKVAENLLTRAKDAKNEQAYVEFDAYIDECSRIVNNLKRQHKIHQQIENVEKSIEKAEKIGANVKNVKQLLKEANSALEKSDFSKASKLVSEARKLTIRLRQFSNAQKQIQQFSLSLKKAKKEFDVKECEDLVKQAQKALKDIEYNKVRQIIASGKKVLQESKRYHIANNNVNKIHEYVEKAKDKGINLKEITPMVKTLEEQLKQKEYNKLSKQATVIRHALDIAIKHKNANDKIIEAQEALEDAKKVGSTVKTATRLLGQAKTALKKKRYPSVHKYASSAIKLAKDGKATAIRRKASSEISSVRFLIKDVKDFGVDVSEAEALLLKADEAFINKDYVNVEKYAREAEESAKQIFEKKKKEYMRKGIKEELGKLELLLEESKELNVNTTKIEGLYYEAQAQFEAGDFESADKSVKEAEKLARKSLEDARQIQLVSKAESSLEELKSIFNEAQKLGIDVATFNQSITELETLFKDKKFEEVVEKSASLEQEISVIRNATLKTRTEKLINSTTALIHDAKNVGADVSEAESIMEEAKASFKAEDYVKADELVKNSEHVAKDAWNSYRSNITLHEITNAQQIISEAKELGIDVKEAQDLLAQGSLKLEENDFDAAEKLIKKAEEIARKKSESARKKKASDSIDNLKNVYTELESSGQPLDEFKELIDNAEKKLSVGDFEAVNEYINRANTISSDILMKERLITFSDRINKIDELIIKIKESGMETGDLDKKIVDIKELYEKKELKNISEQIDQIETQAQNLLLERRKEISTKELSHTIESIGKTREIGGNVLEAEKYLTQAEKIIGEEEFDIINAQQLLSRADTEAQDSWTKRKTEMATEAVSSAQTLIQETKELGADVTDAEKLLHEAETMFKDEDFDTIDEQLLKVNDMLQSTKKQQKSKRASAAVSSTKALLAKTREMGANVANAQELLQQAEGMFKDEDFDAVDEYIKKAESTLKSSQMEIKRDETSKLVSSTQAQIAEGREKGADVSEAENLLKEAESMLLTEADFDAVENLIKMSQTSLASAWGQYKSQKTIDDISNMHGRIVQFRSFGLDVSKAERLLHDAEAEYKKEEFENVEELLSKVNQIIDKEYDDQFNKKITLLINEVQNIIKEAKDKDLDVSVGEDMLQQAMVEFEGKNYLKAEELAKKAKEVITEIIDTSEREEIQDLLDKVNGLILDAKGLEIDVTPAERLFRQAKALFKTKEYDSCREYIEKSEKLLNTLAKKYVTNIHPHLTMEVVALNLVANKWNKFIIKISNDGQIQAQDIDFNLKGDFEIKGKKKIRAIDTEGTFELELGLKSKKVGDLPVNILMKCNRPFDRNEYRFTDSIKIKFREVGSFVIEDVFLIYKDGCLILHETREFREMVDDDIFSGMLIAVQNFVSDSFKRTEEEGLKRLDFGKNKILMERGPMFFIAVVIEGEEPGMLTLYLVETINEIQDKFGAILEDWDGNLDKLNGIEEIVQKLLNISVIEDTKELQLPEEDSTITSVQSLISEVKDLGIDTSAAEKELEKAETMAESSNYSSVWNQVQKANDMVRQARRDYYHDDVTNAISTVKEDISEVKETGADVSELENIYVQMKEMVESEDFKQVLESVKSSKQKIGQIKLEKNTLSAYEKMDSNLNIASDWGIDLSDVKQEKGKVVEAIDEKDFEKAKNLISKINDGLKQNINKITVESISSIAEANKNIEEGNEIGFDTGESDKLVTEAKQSINDLDLSKANELLQQVSGQLSNGKNNFYQGKATETIGMAKGSMSELKKMNINVNDASNLLTDAENNFGDNNFIAAYDLAVKAQQVLDDASHAYQSKAILETITSTEEMVSQALARGLDQSHISFVEELISQSREALESRDYKTAGEMALKANSTARETFTFLSDEQTKLKAQLDSTMSVISTTKEAGADTAEVESLVSRMQKMLDDGDIESTKEYMKNIQDTLDQLQIPFKTQLLTKEIKSLDRYITDSKEKGIDTTEPEHLVENAKTVLETDDFNATEEYTKKARDILDKANETHRAIVISEIIQSTYKLAEEVKKLGIEVSYSIDLLKQAEEMLKNMDLDTAEEFANNALKSTEEVKRQFLSKEASEEITRAEEEIAQAMMKGLKTIDAERLLDQAKNYLKAEDFENSKQYAKNTQQLVQDIIEKKKGARAKEALASTKQLHEDVKNLGADVTEVEGPLMQAEASFNNKDYSMAINYLESAKNVLNEIRKPFLVNLAQTALDRAQTVIADAQKYGADIAEAQNIYTEAQQAFRVRDFNTVEEKAKKAERMALAAQEKYYGSYISNEIKTLKENIQKLKTQGHDITVAEGMLDKINGIYLKKDFQELGGHLKALHEHLIVLEQKRFIERATDAVKYTKAMIKYIKNNIKDIGKWIKEPEKLLKKAEHDYKNKVYHRAEQIANEAQHMVENLQHGKLDQFLFVFRQLQAEEMLTEAKKIVADIRKLGVDLSESEELIKNAEEAFKNDSTYHQGQGYLTEAKILAHEQENKFQEKNATSAISIAESLIITLKQNGLNVENANKYLDQAKTAYEIKEFKKSILFAGKAKFTAKKLQDVAVVST